VARVDECVRQYGYCTVAVSEGLSDAEGRLIADSGSKDAFGHSQLGGVGQVVAQLIKDKLGYKYHWALADYLQRSARHIASKVDVEQAYAVGRAAVELALKGHHAVMPAIVRTSDKPYRWKIGVAPLDKVANVEKMLPRDYITPDGFHITAKGRRYLAPLIRGEDYPPYKDGLPRYVVLKNKPVRKKLKTGFMV
jgi:6-phosphofructokinase 1